MKCEKCSKEYPSVYYFKTDTLCHECYAKLSAEDKSECLKKWLIRHPLTSTTFNIEGYRVVKHVGLVRGITVRSRSIFGTIGGALQTLVGGNIPMFTELCEKTREEAFELMVSHAYTAGANGIIGVRYESTEVMDGVTEVLCYGTAVLVEEEKPKEK
jgi:uncharacterized protein YbjQ (UPF0145 family)